MRFEELGDRMKMFEKQSLPERFIPGLPIMARMDGRAFHSFTRGLQRPYDEPLRRCMIETTKELVRVSGARMGYTQSDEITLMFYEEDPQTQIWFDGKGQKLISNLASEATLEFFLQVQEKLPSEYAQKKPKFDARVWQVPTPEEAINAFIWREMDATKNSISMMAHANFSHKMLHGMNSGTKIKLLEAHGHRWDQMPDSFKRGTYVRREKTVRPFTTEEIDKLPEKHEARFNPNLMVERTDVVEMSMPPIHRVYNKFEVFFEGDRPRLKAYEDPEDNQLD